MKKAITLDFTTTTGDAKWTDAETFLCYVPLNTAQKIMLLKAANLEDYIPDTMMLEYWSDDDSCHYLLPNNEEWDDCFRAEDLPDIDFSGNNEGLKQLALSKQSKAGETVTVIIEETVSQTFEVFIPNGEDAYDVVKRMYDNEKLVVESTDVQVKQMSIDDADFIEF